jgi:hypothetical protein
MIRAVIFRRSWLCLILVLAAAMLFATSCLMGTPQKTAPIDKVQAEERSKYDRLAMEHQKLRQTLVQRDATCSKLERTLKKRDVAQRKLEDRVAQITIRLLEKDRYIEEIQERQIYLQKRLDEAIKELLSAKAKLRSLESEAEAASSMAETEIALKALKMQRTDQEKDPSLIKAEELLKMSAQEFKKENYGGALYLVNQAKSHIKNTRVPPEDRDKLESTPGEVLFSLPLTLKVIKKSNVREGPGKDFKVIATLEPDTLLIGYSYKGQWIRVGGANKMNGWIFQTLVSGR